MKPVQLSIPTPDFPLKGKIPFSKLSVDAPPTIEQLGKHHASLEPRQIWVQEQMARIAGALGGNRIPWAFQFSDGHSFQLDKGSVGIAIENGFLARPTPRARMNFLKLTQRNGTKQNKSRSQEILGGVTAGDVRAAATFIRRHSEDEVKKAAGTRAWARDSHVIVEGNKFPTKILGVIAKKIATGETIGTRFANTHAFLRAFAELGFHPTQGGADEELRDAETAAERNGEFDPRSTVDARTRVHGAIVQRRGRPAFRNALLSAYGGQCALTGCDVREALEAAHIAPYMGRQSDATSNGLLLRADIHTLFDLDLIAVDPKTRQLRVSALIAKFDFAKGLSKLKLRSPQKAAHQPNKVALQDRLARLK